jgi:hypothetical protein
MAQVPLVRLTDLADAVDGLTAGVQPWTALGNLGATETIAPADTGIYRYAGTLNSNCTITVTLDADEQFDLALTQDGTGGRTVTWSGVSVWLTTTGTAGVPSTAAGAYSRFYFEKVNGLTYGYHLTESIQSETNAGVVGQGGITGVWYTVPVVRPGNAAALTAGQIRFIPWWVPRSLTLAEIGIWITTGAGSSTMVAAVYDDDNSGKPGTRLLDINSGAAWDTSSSGFKTTTGLSLAVSPGFYWLAILPLTAGPSCISSADPVYGAPAGATVGATITATADFTGTGGLFKSSQSSLGSSAVGLGTLGAAGSSPLLLVKTS